MGGATGLCLIVAVRLGWAVAAGPSTVPDTTELAAYLTSLLSGPLTVTSREAGLLLGGMITLLDLEVVVLRSRPPLCTSENRLMTSNCSSGALSGIWPITMYRSVRKLI